MDTKFNNYDTPYIKLSPIFPNKLNIYSSSVQTTDASWFLCARPFYDKSTNLYAVELSRYTNFFSLETGKSYHITFDATEKEECKLVDISHPYNTNVIDFGNTESNNTESNNTENFDIAIKLGFCGIARKLNISDECNKCKFVCHTFEFLISSKVLEESKRCSYIDYALSHHSYLNENILNFPGKELLKNSKPGKISLLLRKLLNEFFSI